MELAPYWSNLFHRKISRFLEEFVFIDFASKLSSWWTNLNKLIFSAFSSAFNCLRMMLNQFVEYRRVRENLAIGIGNYFTNMFFFAFHFFVTVFQDQNLKSRRLRESKETLKKLLLQERQERLSPRKRELLFSREPKLTPTNTLLQKELSLMPRELPRLKVHTSSRMNKRSSLLSELRVL